MCTPQTYIDYTTTPPTVNAGAAEQNYFYGAKCLNCNNQAIPTVGKYQCLSTSELGYMYDYNMKSPNVDKCVRYSYYISTTVTPTTIVRGQQNADYTWSCEACQAGYWLIDDIATTTATLTPQRRICSAN